VGSFISDATKSYVLTNLKDTTNGLIKISIYDDGNSFIGSEQTIAWGVPTDGSMPMSSEDIAFSIPVLTVVAGIIVQFYNGSALTTGATYPLEEQKVFSNGGIFTVTGAMIKAL
jgi:hypothetical protein